MCLSFLCLVVLETGGCAVIHADFQLQDGRFAHVHGYRVFTQSDVRIDDKESGLGIQYGARSQVDELRQLMADLRPFLAALAAGAVGVPVP